MAQSVFSLSGKTAVITGGGSGIGESISRVFAQQGAEVHIFDVDLEKAEQVTAAIRENGGTAHPHQCDVSDYKQVQQLFNTLFSEKKLDILVNNAAIAHIGTVETTTEEELDRVYKVNIKGIYNCAHAAVKKMKNTGGGVILNMASVASVVGIASRFAYSMSKGAVLTMTYSIAKDYLEHNIRCNCIGPARVHTPFVDGYLKQHYPGKEQEMFEQLSQTQPIGRMGKPEEIAYMALYLCSDEAGFLTGTLYPIDGGFITLNT